MKALEKTISFIGVVLAQSLSSTDPTLIKKATAIGKLVLFYWENSCFECAHVIANKKWHKLQ